MPVDYNNMVLFDPVGARMQGEQYRAQQDQAQQRNALARMAAERDQQGLDLERQRMQFAQDRMAREQAAAQHDEETAWIRNAVNIAARNPQAIPALVQAARSRGLDVPDNVTPEWLSQVAIDHGVDLPQAPVPFEQSDEYKKLMLQYQNAVGLERTRAANARELEAQRAAAAQALARQNAMGRAPVDKAAQVAAANENTWNTYVTAREGLLTGLSGAETGPVAGRLPAMTADAQKADGGVSAMAPVLKQIFRVAGEGTFTDKDQDLLLNMVPTRKDEPKARNFKIANIDRIIRQKLGLPALAAPLPTSYDPSATGLTADEQAELAALRARFGGRK